MSANSFLIVFISVALSALAQTVFKIGVERIQVDADASVFSKAMIMLFSPYVLSGLALYGMGTVLWLFALRQLDLTLAYPFVAMSFILVLIFGTLFLGEPLTGGRILGVSLIVFGLIVIAQTA